MTFQSNWSNLVSIEEVDAEVDAECLSCKGAGLEEECLALLHADDLGGVWGWMGITLERPPCSLMLSYSVKPVVTPNLE